MASEYRNRPVLQRARTDAPRVPSLPAIASSMKHPHRALPPGQQWLPHDKANGKAAQRRRRQMQRAREKAAAKIPAPSFPEPVRIDPA